MENRFPIEKSIDHIIDNICDSIQIDTDNGDPTLLQGIPGIMLALGYAQKYHLKYTNPEKLSNTIAKCFEFCLSALNERELSGSLFYGITGIAYSIRTLHKLELLEIDKLKLDEYLLEVEDGIQQVMLTSIKENDFDLFTGAIGNAIYFLDFGGRTENLIKLLNYFETKAIQDSDQKIYWNAYQYNEQKNIFEYDTNKTNLGLAHGMPSVLSILCKLYKNNIGSLNSSKSLINGVANWIIDKEVNNSICSFPHFYYSDNKLETEEGIISRLAWCYGDLGVSIALFHAGFILNDQSLITKARAIAIKSAQFRDNSNAMIFEHGFCHGYFGTAYLFKRLHDFLGDDSLIIASNYWLNQAFDHRDYSISNIGFFQIDSISINNGNEDQQKTSSLQLLEGYAGILLVLLSFKFNIQNKWDSIFLITI